MDVIQYIIQNNPAGANRVLMHYGLPSVQSWDELPEAVDYLIQQFQEPAVESLLQQHPDLPVLLPASTKPKFGYFKPMYSGMDENPIAPDLGGDSPMVPDPGSAKKDFDLKQWFDKNGAWAIVGVLSAILIFRGK